MTEPGTLALAGGDVPADRDALPRQAAARPAAHAAATLPVSHAAPPAPAASAAGRDDEAGFARQFAAEWIALIVALAIVGVLIAWSLFKARSAVDATERDRLSVQAKVVDDNVGLQLDGMNRALASARDEFLATPVYSVSTLLSMRLKALSDAIPGVRSMVLLDADGNVVASSVDTLIGRDFHDRDYFAAARAGANPATLHVASPVKTALGMYTVVFARAIVAPNGAFVGTAAAALEPEYFKVLLRSVLYAPDMWASLGHGDGKMFVSMPDDVRGIESERQPAFAALIPSRLDPGTTPVVVSGAGPSSDSRLTAISRIAPAELHMDRPLTIAVSRAAPDLFAPWRQQAFAYSLFFVLLSGGAAFGLYRGQWRRRSFAELEASAARERRASAEQLAVTLQGAELGLWDWDLRADRFVFNELARLQLGFAQDELAARDRDGDWRRRVHRSDGARLLAAVEAHFRGEVPAVECEFRIRHKEGHWIWLLTRGKVVERDSLGVPTRLAGTHIDITRRKTAEARSERNAEMLRRTGELASIGGWELELAQMRVEWSEQVLRLLELEPGSTPTLDEVLAYCEPEGRPSIRAAIEGAAREGTPWDLELPFVTAAGQARWVRTQGIAVVEDGRPARLLGAFQDITEKKTTALELHRLNERLTRLSTTDALTEIGNRRLFDQALKTEWQRAARRGGSLGLLMIDVDHFKDYNDHYGHPAGDEVLRQIARMVGESVRRGGELVARYGGEEFALLLPGADLEAARAAAERCRERIADAKIEHRASATSAWIGVSIGVASQVASAEVACSVLVETADAALYRAKRCGRGRIEY